MCDCGYAFDRDASIRARLAGYQPLAERQRPGGIPWRVNWVGMFFGGVPFFAILLYQRGNGIPTSPLVALGRWGGAIVGILAARWIYRRQHPADVALRPGK